MSYNSSYLGKLVESPGPVGMTIWYYDTVDVTTDVDGAGYISDAKKRGMQKGDLVYVRIWTTAPPVDTSELQTAANAANILTAMGVHVVLGISATTGAADLTNVTALTVTNSD
jgi:hypothetical protein